MGNLNVRTFSMRRAIGVIPALALLLSGCGGGTSATNVPVANPIPAKRTVSGKMQITIPPPAHKAHRRRVKPKFVSPSTKSVAITVNGGTAQVFDVAVPPCTTVAGGGLNCTFDVTGPVGTDTFVVTLYDAAHASGTVLGTGSATSDVSSGFGVHITITAVLNAITLHLGNATLTPRVASTTSLTVNELDPDGNPITGTYPFAIALASTDTTGAVTVSPAHVTTSGQAVTVTYTGSTMLYGGAAITATASGATPAVTKKSTFSIATPCAPAFTPTNLYAMWDTNGGNNLLSYPPPFTGVPSTVGNVSFPVAMSIDPTGRIFITQANTSSFPAYTANVVYYPPSSTAQVPVTPSDLNAHSAVVDDQGNLFVSEDGTNSGVYEAPGPLPAVGSLYAAPVRIPNSPSLSGALQFDKYCNLFVDGTSYGNVNYVEVFGTTGQSGGGYGQLTPTINTNNALTGSNGMAIDSKGNLFIGGAGTVQELAPPYTGTPATLPFAVSGGALLSLAVDSSDNLFFADYANDVIGESSPPYSTYVSIQADYLTRADGVVIGGPAPTAAPSSAPSSNPSEPPRPR
jgi:hypothetical protein